MPCFEHEPYHELPSVPAGTEVFLDRDPRSAAAPVTIYLWATSPGGCEEHNTQVIPDVRFTHKARLARPVEGFVRKKVCREFADGERKVLFAYAGSGADVRDVCAQPTPVCD